MNCLAQLLAVTIRMIQLVLQFWLFCLVSFNKLGKPGFPRSGKIQRLQVYRGFTDQAISKQCDC
jgi:hypothetical protein